MLSTFQIIGYRPYGDVIHRDNLVITADPVRTDRLSL